MVSQQPVRALALILAMTFGVGFAHAEGRMMPGVPIAADLVGGQADFHIETGPGDYIAGMVAGHGAALTVDLLYPDGRHFRRLARDAAGSIRFQAVSESDGLTLRITGTGEVDLMLEALVPPAAQLPAPVDYLSPRIAALARQLAAGEGESAESFWREVTSEGTPLVEAVEGQQVMTFLWRGASRNVRLFGGPSNDHEWLERLGNSDVWFKSFSVPAGTRLSYRLAPDVPGIPGNARVRRGALLATAQVDPLNHWPMPVDALDRFNQDATITLPGAAEQPGWPPGADTDPQIDSFTFDSPRLENSREITISHPHDWDPADPATVLLFLFDGEKALSEMQAPRLLDGLTRDGQLPPVVTVLIPSLDTATRSRELPDNDLFADVLAQDLLPVVLAQTGLRHDPARTVLAGASYGGLAAASVAMRQPQAFGNVLSMSGSFWWAPEGTETEGTPYVAARIAAAPPLPLRFFLSAGAFETGRDGNGGILETSRILRDTLRLKGYAVEWRDYAGGHDYIIWRGALADGMIALFGIGG